MAATKVAQKPAAFYTVGAIARRCGAEIHNIEYLIASRGITPIGKAGQARVFDEAACNQIAAELRKVRSRRKATA